MLTLCFALQVHVTFDGEVTARTERPDGEIVTVSLAPQTEQFDDVEKRLESVAGTAATRRAAVRDGALRVRVPVDGEGEYVLSTGDAELPCLLANPTALLRDADRDGETVRRWIDKARELCARRDDLAALRHGLERLRDREIGSLSKPFRLDASRRHLAALIGRVGTELDAQRYLDDGLAPPDPSAILDACVERLEECARVAAHERSLWSVKVLRALVEDDSPDAEGRRARLLERLDAEPELADALAALRADDPTAAREALSRAEERVRHVEASR